MTSTLCPPCARAEEALTGEVRPAAPSERAAALSVLFQDRPRRTREALFGWARQLARKNHAVFDGLVIATRSGQVCGTIWGQPIPGRQTAIWLPALTRGEPQQTGSQLVIALDEQMAGWPRHVAFVSVNPMQMDLVAALSSCDFRFITDLARMVCPVAKPRRRRLDPELEFVRCTPENLERLTTLIPRTYSDSLDCPAMQGIRRIDDVLTGHLDRNHGQPDLWRIVHHNQREIGCLVLTRHDERPECEVSYLGLVPEARGRGWGSSLIHQAQQLSHLAGVQNLFLSCDVSNPPALKTYQRAGFREIDRSSVFLKPYP